MRNPDRWSPSKYVQRGDRLVASHDRTEVGIGSRLAADAVAARYAEHLPRFARGRLIDLGCGKVPLYGAYRGLVSEVTCVDWANSPHASLHLDCEVDLGAPLPFADAAFDTVILSDVLEHVSQPELLWREMARLLAPGGHALVNVPFLYGIHEAPHDYFRYTEFALRQFAAQAGMRVELLVVVGGSLHVFADLLAKHLARVPLLGTPLALGIQGAVSLLDRSAWGRRFAEKSGARFPLGYFMVAERPPNSPPA
jgi:SAM-dependent methyltransferase